MHKRLTNRISLFTLILLFTFTAGGCFASIDQFAAEAPQPREGNVVLVRGLMDVFSLGLYDIQEDLEAEGVNAKSVSGLRWPDVSKTIRSEYDQGKIEGPLVIVGHSYGADDAVRLARDLGRYDIEVTFLALIDPTTPPKIPTNVQRCFNVYKSHPSTDWVPFLRGIAVEGETDLIDITNYDINDHNEDGRFGWNNHFDIEEDRGVQLLVVEQVLRACPPNKQYVKTTDGENPSTTVSQVKTHESSSNGTGGVANAQPQ